MNAFNNLATTFYVAIIYSDNSQLQVTLTISYGYREYKSEQMYV